MDRISEESSNKIYAMSFLCACMVVAIHAPFRGEEGTCSWWGCYLLKNGICRIAVPFFFLMSGFFLARHSRDSHWWSHESRKRGKTLLVPYLLWSVLKALYDLSMTLSANLLAGESLARNLPAPGYFVSKTFGLIPWEDPLLGPLWYVRNLLLLVLCSVPIVRIMGNTRRTGLFGLCTFAMLYALVPFWGVYPSFFSERFGLFLRCFFSLEGLFYFSLGVFLARWSFSVKISRQKAVLLLVISLSLFTLTGWAECKDLPLSAYPRWVAIPMAMTAVWSLLPGGKLPESLAHMSFPLYCLHMFILFFLEILFHMLGGENVYDPLLRSIWGYFAVIVVAIGGTLPLVSLSRRCFPHFSSLLFGGR